ncbi:hypothetical protein KI387_039451, partial [Taxus chinensis]
MRVFPLRKHCRGASTSQTDETMARPPPSKRPRLFVRGKDDYLPGNIVEIEIHNFMTYNHLMSKPGPRLNLVIGPNGTGKSSLVCAIAIGLAGEPQLLGRASNIGDYVKRGEESGWIKISLRGNREGETITIRRKMDKQNKSEWQLNGQAVPKREVLDIIRKFNIQVGNLTQFLPQDRVCEFAKLSPIQLLEETEKAVGDQELFGKHCALIEKSRDLKRLKITVKQNEETLSQLSALNAEQEKDVERVRQRQQLLQKVEYMKKKLPWLKYDTRKNRYMEAKENKRAVKRKRDDIARSITEKKAPIEEKNQQKIKIEASCKKLKSNISSNDNKRREIIQNENQLSVQVRAKASEIEEVKKQEESRQERVARAKDDLAAAEAELAKLPVYEPPKEEIESLGAQIRELEISNNEKKSLKREKGCMLEQERSTLHRCISRLKDIESTNIRLLQALKDSGVRQIFEAVEWVKNHSNDFKKKVYGPVLVEVNVSSKSHTAYLEGHVPYYIWKSFITQDPCDRDLLVKNLKPFDIPVLNYIGNRQMQNGPQPVSDAMRNLGITSRLDEVFEAPSAVKEVLISQAALDHSVCSHKCVFVKNTLAIHNAIIRNHHPTYVDMREVNELICQRRECEEHIGKLGDDVKLISSEQMHLEDEAAKLHRKREEIVNNMKSERIRRQEMVNRIDQRRRKLKSMENEEDLETTISRLTNLIGKLNVQRFKCAIEMKDLLIGSVSIKRQFAQEQLTAVELDMKIREMERELREPEKQGIQAQQELDRCEDQLEQCRRQLQIAKGAAESVAKLNPELQQVFLEMPETVEELEAAMQDCIAQANAVMFLNPNVLEEYERRCEQISNLTLKVEEDKLVLNKVLAEVNSLKETWLPTLRCLVTRINETFGHNFQEMAVAGEITLDEHDMDFDKYGILIKVKFRQTGQLQVLSAHHQSGGERSVSTILYLVSLQDLTHCPFRVVDEINQGMDPINERNMFQQLVRAASQPNTPQCFLLTPKLLPDLDYTEACSILTIMNGPWIDKTSK